MLWLGLSLGKNCIGEFDVHGASPSSLMWSRSFWFTGTGIHVHQRKVRTVMTPISVEGDRHNLFQLYQALRMVSQTIFRAESPDELFEETCRIIVEVGGFSLAWIGMTSEPSVAIQPVAVAGDKTGYVKAKLRDRFDLGDWTGPTAKCLREGRVIVINDSLNDPTSSQWKDLAIANSILSSGCFPITANDEVIGVLSVYAGSVDFFMESEIGLLEETAHDLSIALHKFRLEAERAARVSELNRIKDILDSSSDAIVTRDLDNRITTWNKGAENLLGWTAEEVIGSTAEQFVPPDRRSDFIVWLATSGDVSHLGRELSTVRLHKDGTPIPVSLVINPLRNEVGETIGAVASLRDRSIGKEVSEELDRFFSHWRDLACVANTEGFLERVSDSWTATFGWTVEELRDHPYVDLVHPEDVDSFNEVLRGLLTGAGPIDSFEFRFRGKDGSYRILSFSAAAINQGKIYASARDITDLRKAQNEILDLNRRLVERATELEDAVAVADRANQAKSDFLSKMSHELRTPLNSVMGFAQVLQMKSTDPGVLECADSILRAGRHLLAVVTDILDISKVEAGRLDCFPEMVPISGILNQAIESVHYLAAKRNIEIEFASDIACINVFADRKRLAQIFINLLSNAVKYNRHGGSVRIFLKSTSATTFRIAISNTGKPIPLETVPKLFRAFERAPGLEVSGTGLGLALSLELAKLMNGNLVLDHSHESETEFVLEIPSFDPNRAEYRKTLGASRQRKSTSRPLDIVYVGDRAEHLRGMEAMLHMFQSVELRCAIQPEGGLALMKLRKPDVLLVSLEISDGGAEKMIDAAQHDPGLRSIPIIGLLSEPSDRAGSELRLHGVSSILMRPFSLDELFIQIERVLGSEVAG